MIEGGMRLRFSIDESKITVLHKWDPTDKTKDFNGKTYRLWRSNHNEEEWRTDEAK